MITWIINGNEYEGGDSVPETTTQPGKRVGAPVADEAEHFTICEACGQAFDMRDFMAMAYHCFNDDDHKPQERN